MAGLFLALVKEGPFISVRLFVEPIYPASAWCGGGPLWTVPAGMVPYPEIL